MGSEIENHIKTRAGGHLHLGQISLLKEKEKVAGKRREAEM